MEPTAVGRSLMWYTPASMKPDTDTPDSASAGDDNRANSAPARTAG